MWDTFRSVTCATNLSVFLLRLHHVYAAQSGAWALSLEPWPIENKLLKLELSVAEQTPSVENK
jgi:hypothetical protein